MPSACHAAMMKGRLDRAGCEEAARCSRGRRNGRFDAEDGGRWQGCAWPVGRPATQFPALHTSRPLRRAINFTPAMSARTPRPLEGLTILVIDDHRETVELLREYLYSVGATVVGAGSAKAALAFAE